MTKQINIRLNDDDRYGIGISPLIKVFLRSFVTQQGVGFWVGDAELSELFRSWVRTKDLENLRGKRFANIGHPPFRKLFEI
jgi:hypothetical protein